MELIQLNIQIGIARLAPDAELPEWSRKGSFYSVTKTGDELSIVCEQRLIPENVKCDLGWSILKVNGPLDFALTGTLSSLALPLAEARISIFAISSFDTDYLLLKKESLSEALRVLREKGHLISTERKKEA